MVYNLAKLVPRRIRANGLTKIACCRPLILVSVILRLSPPKIGYEPASQISQNWFFGAAGASGRFCRHKDIENIARDTVENKNREYSGEYSGKHSGKHSREYISSFIFEHSRKIRKY